jgi:outer membrane protein OmpA-like peptidoglycan-associated protein
VRSHKAHFAVVFAISIWMSSAAQAEVGAAPDEDQISQWLAPKTEAPSHGLFRGIPRPGTSAPNPAIATTSAHPTATFNTIQFEFGSARLTPSSMTTLRNLGNALNHKLHDQLHFLIEGHTDATGPATYNVELSRQRARSVLDYLVETMSVSRNRLQAVGKGSSDPISGSQPSDAINRRVVVINLENSSTE